MAAATSKPAGSPRDTPTLDRLRGINEAVAWGWSLARNLAATGRAPSS